MEVLSVRCSTLPESHLCRYGDMKPTIQPFIFTWRGKFESACAIERELLQIFDNVTVINSDDEITRPGWINVGESSFFSAQFRKALELFTADILFHVQADVHYDRWRQLVEDASSVFQNHKPGIYAPNVDYSWWTAERNDIVSRRLEPSALKLVACSDETVWFIKREVIQGLQERQIDFSGNAMGWGWDCMLAAVSYLKGMPVIRDYRHTIQHPQGTGYNTEKALAEMNAVVNSLDAEILRIYSFMRNDREQLASYLDGP